MSHFSVLVCLPDGTDLATLEDRLGEIMAPWDENRELPVWREYEDGGAEDYWWVRSVRKAVPGAAETDDALWAERLGPKRLLDFEAMRADAAKKAYERYDKWLAVCDGTPPAKSWSHFGGLVEVKEMSIDAARAAYDGQPRIQKARATKLDSGWGDVVEEFLSDRDEYAAEARRGAVPGYALVTLEGQWLAPGRMGWFGMSSDDSGDRNAYRVAANRYLEDLKDDRLVVALDCHI